MGPGRGNEAVPSHITPLTHLLRSPGNAHARQWTHPTRGPSCAQVGQLRAETEPRPDQPAHNRCNRAVLGRGVGSFPVPLPGSLSLFSASPGLLRPTTLAFPLTLAAVLSGTRADSALGFSQAVVMAVTVGTQPTPPAPEAAETEAGEAGEAGRVSLVAPRLFP